MDMKIKGMPLVETEEILNSFNNSKSAPLVGLWGGHTWAKDDVFTPQSGTCMWGDAFSYLEFTPSRQRA